MSAVGAWDLHGHVDSQISDHAHQQPGIARMKINLAS